jgi:hypothetical protein
MGCNNSRAAAADARHLSIAGCLNLLSFAVREPEAGQRFSPNETNNRTRRRGPAGSIAPIDHIHRINLLDRGCDRHHLRKQQGERVEARFVARRNRQFKEK